MKGADFMSTLELVEKMESLSSEDYNMIAMLIERLSSKVTNIEKLSKDEIVEELLMSAKQSDQGHVKDARSVSKAMRDKYAV